MLSRHCAPRIGSECGDISVAAGTSSVTKVIHPPFPPHHTRHVYSFFGSRFLNDKSYTTSSTSFTLYFNPSLRRRRLSFLRLRIWKPACRSLTNWLIWSGRS
jgi:hypothetical protein